MPPNPQNLKAPWKKGQSGNLAGRPRLPSIQEALAKVLADEKDGRTALDVILSALRAKAAKGDVRAAEVLLDRAFGKSMQLTDITSGGESIRVVPPIAWTDDAG